MAFWRQASSTNIQTGPSVLHTVGAKPITIVLHSSSDFSTLVRLRVKAPCTTAAAGVMDVCEDGETAEQAVLATAAAVGKLHQLMLGLDVKSAEARKHSISHIMSSDLLQLLCQKVSSGW